MSTRVGAMVHGVATQGLRVAAELLLLGLLSIPVRAADVENGKAVYRLWCSDCHAATGGRYVPPAGYTVLQKRYEGKLPAELTQRTDLQPVYIRAMVRNGLNVMPRTRKTEISDAELEDLIAFLTQNNH